MGVCTVAVTIVGTSFYLLIVDRYQQSHLENLQSLAAIIGLNSNAALAFNIPEDANDILASLNRHHSIVAATIYDKNGNYFASFHNGSFSNNYICGFDPHKQLDQVSRKDHIHIFEDILLGGNKIGTLRLCDSMQSVHDFQQITRTIILGIILAVLLFIRLMASGLNKLISKPISNLAEIANKISIKHDYSLRAAKESEDEIGSLVTAFNLMLDQIARRTAKLTQSEKRFRTLVDQAVDAFFLHDLTGQIIDVNQRACLSLGYSREELLTMNMLAIDTKAKEYKKKSWRQMLPEKSLILTGTYRRKDGDTYPVEICSGLLEGNGEKRILALARDMTDHLAAEKERTALADQLQQARKMESIGILAGGIAHDFNNILTPIFGYLELAKMKTEKESALAKDLQEVQKAASKAKELVQQILALSRKHDTQKTPVTAHVIIKDALKLLDSSIPKTIEIRKNITACGSVLADPSQIHQITMNLCTNSYHAMQETGGILTVSLTSLNISARDFIKNINIKPGKYLKIEISDTGCGMDQAILDKIFEPYFTTKSANEGTGLGLAIIHGIVKEIGGHITVYSEVGKGTTFNIYLPVIKESASETETIITGGIPTGREKIMLVDDEKMVRETEENMLAALGYTVISFDNPLTALEHFTAQPESFNLVITDMTMPKMTGGELAIKIMAIRADMPVILCTGFSRLIDQEAADAIGLKGYLTKPITLRELGYAVRNVLDEK